MIIVVNNEKVKFFDIVAIEVSADTLSRKGVESVLGQRWGTFGVRL